MDDNLVAMYFKMLMNDDYWNAMSRNYFYNRVLKQTKKKLDKRDIIKARKMLLKETKSKKKLDKKIDYSEWGLGVTINIK